MKWFSLGISVSLAADLCSGWLSLLLVFIGYKILEIITTKIKPKLEDIDSTDEERSSAME